MSRYSGEKVLVIPRSLFDELGAFHGFQPDGQRYLDQILNPEHNSFLPREVAEEDPAFKQIIPYAIFHCGDRVLHYVRSKQGAERRLASKGSIGIGGHVNESDYHVTGSLGRELYLAGVEREIREELKLSTGFTQKICGLINEDDSEVGRVHLGVVHLFCLDSMQVESNEEAITQVEFLTREELDGRMEQMESWSKLLINGLDKILDSNELLV